jgi:hypothetical protein
MYPLAPRSSRGNFVFFLLYPITAIQSSKTRGKAEQSKSTMQREYYWKTAHSLQDYSLALGIIGGCGP